MTGYVYGASDPAKRPRVATGPRRKGHRERDVVVDGWGNIVGYTDAPPRSMTTPVRCTCGTIYDLAAVTVTGRYADCSTWVTPCCRRAVDDRPRFPGEPRPFVRLDANGMPRG